MTTLIDLAPAAIAPSPFNHRRKFVGLDELAASIREKGLINPITVRPVADTASATAFELVAGERRWRAAKLAELVTMPVIVRELTDREVIEVQLIENVQRENVHPMEEAEGYQVLIDKHGYDVEQIAAKTAKSRTAVYNRLKLLRLSPTARAAFLEDKFNASIAELLARIPTSQLQDQAVAEIVRGRRASRYDLMSLGEGEPGETERPPVEAVEVDTAEDLPLTTREAQLMLQRRYMLRLELAPFDLTDAKLTSAPACSACTYRTGNQPDLFGDVPSADVCTNPPCYAEKRDADWERKAAAAQAEGRTVMSEEESVVLFQGDSVRYGSGYIDLAERAEWQFQPERGGGEVTWGEVLGDIKVPMTLARDEGGTAHELADKESVLEALRYAGKLPRTIATASDKPKAKPVDKAKQAADLELRTKVAARAIGELAAPLLEHVEGWRWLAVCLVRSASPAACDALRADLGLELGSRKGGVVNPNELVLLAHLDGVPSIFAVREFVARLTLWEGAVHAGVPGYGDALVLAAKTEGLDLAKLAKKVAAEVKAAKAKPAKKGKAA